MAKKKDHGQRNKNLSLKLFQEKEYYDWVITTAFYSAIHFVEDKILPETIRSKQCKNIKDVKNAYRCNGRHEARERLVWDKLDSHTAVKYKWLDDKSRYSRYTTFKISVTEADKATQYLNDIYNACYN